MEKQFACSATAKSSFLLPYGSFEQLALPDELFYYKLASSFLLPFGSFNSPQMNGHGDGNGKLSTPFLGVSTLSTAS
jgi:hypothetical protein